MDERTSSAFIPFKKCPPIYKHTDLYIEIILVEEPLTVTVEQVHFPILLDLVTCFLQLKSILLKEGNI